MESRSFLSVLNIEAFVFSSGKCQVYTVLGLI